ncbi:flagella biosynthesis regulatory protein FliT [Pectobacteriaceae bacterium CE90]|nr:flagella biosynthesis regulatory protein FliT [Prodigiosinella sp. LS101]WJV52157.1 flagella biosynthesis regulatory protein FliT [Prodigiosinella sp. LS101]WJV56514.1 flagella biosynthesis regulatory protein FliT [Pectobacteriaceae bacterium C111]WJY16659.1 flagella biosynthesis regulatory protein FliT [Pectobacteriaceae bacterium CE90]
MDNLHQFLNNYRQLLSLSKEILALAINGHWDELVKQEIIYIQSVETLTKAPLPANIDSVTQLHFREILQEIVDNEATVKHLLQKRMDELGELMGKSLNQKNINDAYGKFSQHRTLPGDPQS